MSIEKLTESEVETLDGGKCPDCGSKEFYHGPQGGMNTNVECANEACQARFNLILGMAGSFGKERLSRPINFEEPIMSPEKLLGFKRMKTKEQWLISEQWHEIGNNDILELIARVQQDALASRTPSPELVELKKDKERLDWIAEQESISIHMERDDFVWEISNKTTSLSEHPDLREAIDAAKEKK